MTECARQKPWSTFASATDGCTCPRGPLYYVVVREGASAHKTRVGRNHKEAERALRKIEVAVDEGDFRPQRNVRFAEWATTWLASLERKETTVDSYRGTVRHAMNRFGFKRVRDIRVDDVTDFNAWMRDKGLSGSTRARHLRVLHACLEAALRHEYTTRNPVKALSPAQRPRAETREAAYFLNAELPGLFAELPEGLIRTFCEVALKTGMRQGEVVGLQWGDVDLATATIRVRRTVTDGHLGTPKNHERRDVDLTPDVVELLGRWWGLVGTPTSSEAWVFPGEARHGVMSPPTIVSQFYAAMSRAEVARAGPTGKPRTFHSLRHSYAKTALENGAEITWLSRHLGHSSVTITDGVYGHWERAERKRQAAKLAGAFAL